MPLKFRKQVISSETFEAVGVFDVDGDGHLDLVTGGFWYKGPDFREKRVIDPDLRRYEDYYDEFSVIPMHIAGSGRPDFITGGWWGKTLRWRENPGDPTRPWPVHIIAETGNVESTRAYDIDGDGQLEIVPNTPGNPLKVYKHLGNGRFTSHLICDNHGHGLGFGDVDQDGIGEFIIPGAILKCTGHPLRDPWRKLEDFDIGHWDASLPILVADIDHDTHPEIIVGHAHNYGLDYYKRIDRRWTRFPIDPFCAQYHDLQWVDIDNDGQYELVTGKRHLAHCGRDPGEHDDLGIYYFKWTGAGFAKQVISHGPPGTGQGCGIQFATADLRNSGRLDLIAPGKDGLQIFWNEGT